jgi:hypothetical protein
VCLLRGTFYILRSAHTVYLCVLCGSENKQRFHCTSLAAWFYNRDRVCLLRGTDLIFKHNSSQRSVERFSVRRSGMRIATVLQTEESRFESWRGRKFFLLPLPLPPWSHPPSCLFPWSSSGRTATPTTHLYPMPSLRNTGALPPQETQGSYWTSAPVFYPCFALFWYHPSI